MLYATQPLVAQDRAGIKVIHLTPSRVCGESLLMIHTRPHATAPVQYISTVFDKKSIPTIRTPYNTYVDRKVLHFSVEHVSHKTHISCHKCSEKGHYANECLILEETATNLPMAGVETSDSDNADKVSFQFLPRLRPTLRVSFCQLC
jgi:hypothetical protein